MIKKEFELARVSIYDCFSNINILINTFRLDEDHSIINIGEFVKWYREVETFENINAFVSGITTLLDHLQHDIQTLNKNNFTALLMIIILPFLSDPDISLLVLPKLCDLLAHFDHVNRFGFAFMVQESIQYSGKTSIEQSQYFKQMIQLFQQYLTIKILDSVPTEEPEDEIIHIVQTLSIFAAINETNTFVPFYEFYNETVEEILELKVDFPKWKSREGFSFCNYPFLLSTSIKGDILRIESMIQMRHELQDSFFRAMFIGVNNPYLELDIRRNHVIRDTLCQLEGKSVHDLKKQLRVSFVGEDGIDEGGIQKEFFQLIAKEMFDETYGLFKTNPESRTSWFSYWDDSLEKDFKDEYNLLGKLMGLAFYNGVALDINFTGALYKKLLNIPITIDDLAEYDPALAAGFNKLLAYEGNVEEDFQQDFTIDINTPYNKTVTKELIPNGANITVTKTNREEYVHHYIDFYFIHSVETVYNSFKEGFNAVMDGTAVTLFRPEELQELICGCPSLDFQALKQNTIYDGFESHSPVITYFWDIVINEFTEEQQKHLLVFATGSDRVPIGGLGKLQFVIARNGTDGHRLPSSHTCFNALLLCDYDSKESLKERLLMALTYRNCGFYLS
ncbi:hypothetical protein BC833DRAFT_597780 [Globomyces pollinis-pini]|nr:hypothetical protein BC833DRAFT_597780 [Globomyces pollinis-pini]